MFAEFNEVPKLVTRGDLASAGFSNRRWVKGVPPDVARHALQELGALRVCCHVLSRVLAKGPSSRKLSRSVWYLRMLELTLRAAKSLDHDGEVRKRLITESCVLARNGRATSLMNSRKRRQVVCNTRFEPLSRELGTLFPKHLVMLLHSVYRPPERKTSDPDAELRRRTDQWLREMSNENHFDYESRLDAATFIRRFVVEGAEEGLLGTDTEWNDLLLFVRRHLSAYLSESVPERRGQLLRDLGGILKVRSHSVDSHGKRISSWRLIRETYLSATYLEKPHWHRAAKGIPGLWWIDSVYKRSLVLPEAEQGVVSFLIDLGASSVPVTLGVPPNNFHGPHNFVRVGHVVGGVSQDSPNFPHTRADFNQFSDYGLDHEHKSPDLDRWFRYISTLKPAGRIKRCQELWAAMDSNWDRFQGVAFTTAAGYYSNSKTTLGPVPCIWLWNLQHWDWILTTDGTFTSPIEKYQNNEQNLVLLGRKSALVCAWGSQASGFSSALGLIPGPTANRVLTNLRTAQSKMARLPNEVAREHYRYLAKFEGEELVINQAMREGLIFAPRGTRDWWQPEECLSGDHRETFPDHCGFVDIYPDADVLWDRLGIGVDPDISFLIGFWNRVALESHPSDDGVPQMLSGTYSQAERLLLSNPSPRAQSVLLPTTKGGWWPSEVCFWAENPETCSYLEEAGLHQWVVAQPNLYPTFGRWAAVLRVDSNDGWSLEKECVQRQDEEAERVIHQGANIFAREIKSAKPSLWDLLRARLRDLIHGRVARATPLRSYQA